MPRIVRVAIYVRQSLDAKDDRAAVERQLTACRRWCTDRSTDKVTYTPVERVYDDNDVSATKGTRVRSDFVEMLDDAKAGRFDLIIAYHLDRLTRTIRDLLPLLDLANVHGVGTTTVSGGLDLTTDQGRLIASILASVAQGEVDRKGKRQRDANAQRAEAGDPHGGARPIGYDRIERPRGEEHLPKLVIREKEAAYLRQAYQSVLAERSLTAIASELNKAGLKTTKRKTKLQGAFTHNSVKTVLLNPMYAGMKVYRGEIVRAANWEPIVDEATWRTVRAILTDPDRRTNLSGGHRRWLGTGIYRCGVCAEAGTEQEPGVPQTMVTTYRDGTRVFSCRGSKHLVRVAASIDEYVVDTLCARFARDDAAELLDDHDCPDRQVLTAETFRLRRRRQEASDLFADGAIPNSELRRINARIDARLAEIDAMTTRTDRVALFGPYIDAEDPRAVWDADTLDRQRAILTTLMEVTVLRGRAGGNSRNGPRPLDESTVLLRPLA